MAYLATEFAFFGLSVLDLDTILLLGADAALVYATTYPTSIAEAYQRANSYQLGHSQVTTGTVVDNHQTIFASDTKSDPSYGKNKDRQKTIPHGRVSS